MNVRETIEQRERESLSRYASLSSMSRGRDVPETECDIRTVYQRDRDRILHCKAFRRLKHKTQVFLSPEGDHYRTRLTHTLEVSQIGRTIAKALRLNEDLTEAIALDMIWGIRLSDIVEKGYLMKYVPLDSDILNRAYVLLNYWKKMVWGLILPEK